MLQSSKHSTYANMSFEPSSVHGSRQVLPHFHQIGKNSPPFPYTAVFVMLLLTAGYREMSMNLCEVGCCFLIVRRYDGICFNIIYNVLNQCGVSPPPLLSWLLLIVSVTLCSLQLSSSSVIGVNKPVIQLLM